MARNRTSGHYWFEDGYYCWVSGLSTQEKRVMVRKHGKIVKYIPE